MLYLHHDLKPYFSEDKPLFDQMMALKGESFRNMDGRQTQRVRIGETSYFIKQHHGVGWRQIIKNILQLKKPVISARNEWQALTALDELGVAVPKVVGYGEKGWSPASRKSFVLLEALDQTNSLEDIVEYWQTNKPSYYLKNKLLSEVARITRIMHQHQMNHCDLYICHFLLNDEKNKLYLIDLHRARQWGRLPERWKIKDLAALYFSSKTAGLTRHDYFRFMQAYLQRPLSQVLTQKNLFWQKVKERGEKLYREHA